MRKSLFFIASALVLFVTSCKKEDKKDEVNVQNISGTYKTSKITAQTSGSAEQDVTDYALEDCEKDDLLTFKTDMTFTNVDAGTSCGWGNFSGAWSLTGTTAIVIDGDSYTIRKFDGTNLELTNTETFNSVTATFVTYMVKQ